MEQSLFEKYGGFATVHKVVEHFYDGVLDNDMLSPHFERVDMSRLIDHQTRFFASAMGAPPPLTMPILKRHTRDWALQKKLGMPWSGYCSRP